MTVKNVYRYISKIYRVAQLKLSTVCRHVFVSILPIVTHYKRQIYVCGVAVVLSGMFVLFIQPQKTIGVLDVQRLREQAEPYLEINREKAKYMEQWRVKFQAEQDVLDAEDKKLALAQKNKSMRKRSFRKALEKLQKDVLDLQKKYQKEASKIMMATESATKQIDELAWKQVQKVAQDKGYQVVVTEQMTVYMSETADITDYVIDELNKMAVKINYPDPDTLTPTSDE